MEDERSEGTMKITHKKNRINDLQCHFRLWRTGNRGWTPKRRRLPSRLGTFSAKSDQTLVKLTASIDRASALDVSQEIEGNQNKEELMA